jgi:hypothetical protein
MAMEQEHPHPSGNAACVAVVAARGCSGGAFAARQRDRLSLLQDRRHRAFALSLVPLGRMTACPGASPAAAPAVEARLPPTILDFEGIDLGQLAGRGCSLPRFASDDTGAVGPRHFVQIVNVALAVYDKTGKRLVGPIATTTFWANEPDSGGNQVWSDSVVIYDREADRWVISRPGGLPKGADLCLAVSQTADPTGRWDEYAFEVNNKKNGLDQFFNDYPKISASPRSYFATANPNKIFSGLGNTITAFERAAMPSNSQAAGEPEQQARAARLHRRPVRGVVSRPG